MKPRRIFMLLGITASAAISGPLTAGGAIHTKSDPAVMLNAMNFVLTGSDRPMYHSLDGALCTVILEQGARDFPGYEATVVHFDNIDPSRVTLQKSDVKYPLDPEPQHWVITEIHGAGIVRDTRGVTKSEGSTPGGPYNNPLSDYTFKFESTEYDRLVRAWKFIFTHGCKGSGSGF